MAEYIDREQVCEKCNNKNYCEKEKCPVYKVSTADVVPKSEVLEIQKEQLGRLKEIKSEVERVAVEYKAKREINSLLTEAGQEWQRRYNNAKVEVAREIFEEIWKCMEHDYISSIDVFSGALGLRIAELKKQYTESENG